MVHNTSRIKPKGFAEFVAWIKSQGWTSVWFKVMNGHRGHKGHVAGQEHRRRRDISYFESIAPLLRAEGIEPCPWVYITPEDAREQGERFRRLCDELGAKVAIVNAEIEFERDATSDLSALQWLEGFDNKSTGTTLGLSTFAQPRRHSRFPYENFFPDCKFFSPQCYGTYPVKQLEGANEWAKGMNIECWPCLRAYVGDGIDNKAEILRTTSDALRRCDSLGLPNVMFWQQKTIQAWPEMAELLLLGASGAPNPEPQKKPFNPLIFFDSPAGARGRQWGGAVADAQRSLNFLGQVIGGNLAYLDQEPLKADGICGPKTARAIFAACGQWPEGTPGSVKG
jgi:hypothetical protein